MLARTRETTSAVSIQRVTGDGAHERCDFGFLEPEHGHDDIAFLR